MFIFGGQIYRSTISDRISNFFVLKSLGAYFIHDSQKKKKINKKKKYLDTQNEFIFNKILIIII